MHILSTKGPLTVEPKPQRCLWSWASTAKLPLDKANAVLSWMCPHTYLALSEIRWWYLIESKRTKWVKGYNCWNDVYSMPLDCSLRPGGCKQWAFRMGYVVGRSHFSCLYLRFLIGKPREYSGSHIYISWASSSKGPTEWPDKFLGLGMRRKSIKDPFFSMSIGPTTGLCRARSCALRKIENLAKNWLQHS